MSKIFLVGLLLAFSALTFAETEEVYSPELSDDEVDSLDLDILLEEADRDLMENGDFDDDDEDADEDEEDDDDDDVWTYHEDLDRKLTAAQKNKLRELCSTNPDIPECQVRCDSSNIKCHNLYEVICLISKKI